jgi:molybdopterin adenylyltransferase
VNAAVLTISDGVHGGTRDDLSGDALEELLLGDGHTVTRRVVPDERDEIAAAIVDLSAGAQLVLTTGGTGFAPRDVTPEATADVIERQAPGVSEAIRADARTRTPHAVLSRGVAGLVGPTLVVNLPGSPGAVKDGFAVLRPALSHGLALAGGTADTRHRQT